MPDGGLLGIPAKIAASYKKGQAAGDQAIGNGAEGDEVPGTMNAPQQGGQGGGGGGGKVYIYEEGWGQSSYNDNGTMYYGEEAKRRAVEQGGPGLVDGVTGEKGMSSPPGSPVGGGPGGDGEVPDPAAGGGGYNPMAGWFNRGGGGPGGGNCG